MNRLYFGDNLKWLSDKEFPHASVDLVYLDPPFNSNADYNVLFREPSGQVSQAQFHAFTDTWSWADAADTYHQFIDNCPNVAVVELMEALNSFLKHSPMMAYLAMMAPRLVQLQRILKSTGSLYLHCDPTASHYLRMLLDGRASGNIDLAQAFTLLSGKMLASSILAKLLMSGATESQGSNSTKRPSPISERFERTR